jgi:hypothetical protein
VRRTFIILIGVLAMGVTIFGGSYFSRWLAGT